MKKRPLVFDAGSALRRPAFRGVNLAAARHNAVPECDENLTEPKLFCAWFVKS